MSKVILCISILFLGNSLFAECNRRFVSNLIKDMEKSGVNVPSCSDKTVMLPENGPIAAISITDSNGYSTGGKDEARQKLALDLINSTVNASGGLMPKIFFFGSKQTIEKAKMQIDSMNISAEEKQKAKNSIIHVSEKGYLWQQDYLESYVDSRGRVVARPVQGYFDKNKRYEYSGIFNELAEEMSKCGFKVGEPLVGKEGSQLRSGRSGGNLEALPGGLCVVGSNHFESEEIRKYYAKQVCGADESAHVVAPTTWLRVGHTDEIIKVVKNNKKKSPCDFSIAVASPKKALELLRANKEKPFIDVSGLDEEGVDDRHRRRGGDHLISNICKKSKQLKESKRENSIKPLKKKKTTTRYKWTDWLIKSVYADTIPGVDYSDKAFRRNKNRKCGQITNGEVLEVFETVSPYKESYKLIQEKMDLFAKDLSKKLKEKLPQCGSTDFIQMPSLFYADVVEGNEAKGTKDELVNYDGTSILPNTVNSIPMHNTMILPEPDNKVFKNYIKNQMSSRGLKTDFIDSYETVHFGDGNLHCGTNTFQICKPKSWWGRK